MTPRHRDLDTYSHRLNRAANVVPDVMRHLDEQRSTVIVLSASAYDQHRGSGGTVVEYEPDDDEIEYDDDGKRLTPKVLKDRIGVTPTERTAFALDRIEHRRRGVQDMIETLGRCIDLLDEACRDALGVRGEDPVLSDVPQCSRDSDTPLPDGKTQRCGRMVEHYWRPDGTVAYRDGGACVMHRRREEREASLSRAVPQDVDA